MSVPIQLAPWEFEIPGSAGSPGVKVSVQENESGLTFTVNVLTTSGLTADLRGLFFNVDGDGPSSVMVSGTHVTDFAVDTIDLGNGANMQGGGRKPYDVGVEIGTQGIGKDDIQSTSFFVAGLKLADIYGQEFGARLTSVGAPRRKREGSAKLTQIAPGVTATLQDGLALGQPSEDEQSPLSPVSQKITEGADPTVTYTITVSVPDLPQVADILLTQDLSGSFSDDLPNVRAGFAGLYSSLNADGRDIEFGVASFVDKPFLPFGDVDYGDYVYQTNQSISGIQSQTQFTLDGLGTRNGVDYPECQLEALLQLANRPADVGWREGAQRFVVLSTDAAYHQAGDAALNGYSWPVNNGDGVVDVEDYPSIGHVKSALEAAEITPIFAVTSDVVSIYQQLVTLLGRGAVETLSSDSSNLTQAILNGLSEVTVDVLPTVLSDDFGLVQSVAPAAGYTDVDGPTEVTFDVTLAPSDSYGSDEIQIDFGDLGVHTISVDIAPTELLGSVGADTLAGNNGPNTLKGFEANDQLIGNGGDDRLVGGLGKDTFTGGLGSDTFAFAGGDGLDEITDFQSTLAADPVNDVIEFAASSGLSTFAGVQAASVEVGSDLQIAYTGGMLTLKNIALSDLAEANFAFI